VAHRCCPSNRKRLVIVPCRVVSLMSTGLDILTVLDGQNSHHVGSILQTHVKPLFRANPHPSLNLSTGRKLPRLAGGPLGSNDYYESQPWKKYPGVANSVSWCVRHTNVTVIPIPPLEYSDWCARARTMRSGGISSYRQS
jgi:hypothetical protein